MSHIFMSPGFTSKLKFCVRKLAFLFPLITVVAFNVKTESNSRMFWLASVLQNKANKRRKRMILICWLTLIRGLGMAIGI